MRQIAEFIAVLSCALFSGAAVYITLVASLDRKRLGMTLRVGRGGRSEAFSIRRLGGSRWRLRRTRCAMGFERRFGSQELCE